MNLPRSLRIALPLTAVLGLSLATATPAQAAVHHNGRLESGELGLYYNSDQKGCVFDLYRNVADFYPSKFTIHQHDGPYCAGLGQYTVNNTASYRNWDKETWDVFTLPRAEGRHGWVPPGYVGNASSDFKNKISSAYWNRHLDTSSAEW